MYLLKTNNKIRAYILRGSTGALLLSCMLVALCLAINLPGQAPKAIPPHDGAFFGASRTLSFAERVAYQTAIEDVYWRHRIWPKERHDPKPLLNAVMSQAQLERKVENYLRNSQMLEDHWQRPLSADQLQVEMERMASHTQQPEVLGEIFAALGNDPFVIAECLARATLAERLLTELKAHNQKLYGELNRHVNSQTEAQATGTMAAGRSDYVLPGIAGQSGGCIDDTWIATAANHPDPRSGHTAVWTGSEMIVWGGNTRPLPNAGERYNPSTDSWTATSVVNAPDTRAYHTAVWTGTEMIVWGGYLYPDVVNTGGRYNPSTDSWTATTTTNAPSPQAKPTAVWTGSHMIVWVD